MSESPLRRQIGVFLIALSLALGSLGLASWPAVAWALGTVLNVLAAIAVLRFAGAAAARRAPFAAAFAAAFLTGAATLAPTFAPSPLPASLAVAIGAVTFLAGLVLWLEAFERTPAH